MALKKYNGKLGNVEYDDTQYQCVKDNDGEYFHYIGDSVKGIVPPNGLKDYTNLYMGTNIEEPVVIAEGVKSTSGMYAECQKLKKGSLVPDSVEDMSFMYDGCISLESIPNFSRNAKSLACVCANCSELKSLPPIPGSAKNCDSIALNCENLTGNIIVQNGVQNMSCAFAGCKSLEDKIVLPESVKITTDMYANCSQFDADDDELDDVTYDLSSEDFVETFNSPQNEVNVVPVQMQPIVEEKKTKLLTAEDKQNMANMLVDNDSKDITFEKQ